jgi:multiple sugar transport system substrate-binding protein
MKKRAVSMILAAAMVCGMMAANVSCVSAKGSDEGKVINIYSWNDVRDWKLFIRK